MPENSEVVLRKARLDALIGKQFDRDQVTEILSRLGMHILSQDNESWTLIGPSWRFDIEIEADLIEEIARIYGYDQLPERTAQASQPIVNVTETQLNPRLPVDHLVAKGFREVINYSFIDPEAHRACMANAPAIHVENPIAADMSVMRTSLLPGLLKSVERNLKRQRADLSLFENGLCFVPQSEPASTENLSQVNRIAGVMVGRRYPETWANNKDRIDFYDIKNEVEQLLALSDANTVEYNATPDKPLFHPGQCAEIAKDQKTIGLVGAIHPEVLKALDIHNEVFAFELDLDALLEAQVPEFHTLSKFPEVRRDIAVIVNRQISVSELLVCVRSCAGEQLLETRIFDIYEGQGIDFNKKSVGIGLTFRDYSRTLSDELVTEQVDTLVSYLAEHFQATLR